MKEVGGVGFTGSKDWKRGRKSKFTIDPINLGPMYFIIL